MPANSSAIARKATLQMNFENALGESFGRFIKSPEASPEEVCEVLVDVVGADVSPSKLANLTEAQLEEVAKELGEYFDESPPSIEEIKKAIADTLVRWPVGETLLDEDDEEKLASKHKAQMQDDGTRRSSRLRG